MSGARCSVALFGMFTRMHVPAESELALYNGMFTRMHVSRLSFDSFEPTDKTRLPGGLTGRPQRAETQHAHVDIPKVSDIP